MVTLALLEKASDVDRFLELRKQEHEIEAIAISPSVCWELEARGIPYQSIAFYWNEGALTEIGMDNFHRVGNLCAEIDHVLQEKHPLFLTYGLFPASDDYYFVKLLYDALSLRIAILRDIFEQGCPDELITFAPYTDDSHSAGTGNVPFGEEESVFSQVLSLDGWGITSRVIRRDKTSSKSPSQGLGKLSRKLMPGIKTAASGNSLLYNCLYCARNIGRDSALSVASHAIKNRICGDKRLLLVGFAYNWNYIIPELYRNGYSVNHYEFDEYSQPGSGCSLEIPESIFQKYCTVKGIHFEKLFQHHFLPRLSESVASSPRSIDAFERAIIESTPNAVLFGTKSRFAEHLAARVARHHNIPVLSWQHGAQGINYAPIVLPVEMRNSDLHLCFGDGVVNTFRQDLKRCPSVRIIPVGSHELLLLHRKKAEPIDPPAVLYVTTNYYNNNLYVSSPSILQDNELWQTQRQILDTLGQSGVKTIFKLHPSRCQDEHIRQFLTERAYPNILPVKQEHSYLELLKGVNIVIIDFPSTTLLQAIAAHKTVFVLLKHLKITDTAENLLRKRAYCSDSLDELTGMVQRHLAGETLDQYPDNANTEFLEAYGIYRIDGTVTDRAIDILNSLT